MNKKNDILLTLVAILVAIFAPLFLMGIIYPTFQVFLPEGNVILTPNLRITATILMSIVDFGMAYLLIYHTAKRKKIVFNVVCYILTLLWCIFMGVMWYIAVIG